MNADIADNYMPYHPRFVIYILSRVYLNYLSQYFTHNYYL